MKSSWNIETQHGRPACSFSTLRARGFNETIGPVWTFTCFDNWVALLPWRARAAAILADTWAIVCLLSVSSTVSGCKDRRSCFPTGLKMAIDGGDPGGQWRNFTWERSRLWKILTQLFTWKSANYNPMSPLYLQILNTYIIFYLSYPHNNKNQPQKHFSSIIWRDKSLKWKNPTSSKSSQLLPVSLYTVVFWWSTLTRKVERVLFDMSFYWIKL